MFLYKLKLVHQLSLIFFCVALIMGCYEFLKEFYFKGSETLWESHLITVIVTATFATVASAFIHRWALKVDEQQRIAAVAFESQTGMIITDAQQAILRVNRTFTEITGYTEKEVIGQQVFKFVDSCLNDAAFNTEMRECIQNAGSWQGELLNRRKNGEAYPGELTITAVRSNEGITHYVYALNDITARKAMEEKIRSLAFYDTLTQLPNRSLLNDRISQTMVASVRSRHYCAALFLDLDNFKIINDRDGHDIGDLLLTEVGHRISKCVREIDTVARFGGDEFVVILQDLATDKVEARKEANIVAEKIRISLAQPYLLTTHHKVSNEEIIITHHCSSSIGCALFIDHEGCASDILKWADMAMYEAKENGGNSIRFHKANT